MAVVLVGGQGSRLRPLTDSIPKPLLPVVEVPMIERVLVRFAGAGIHDAVLALGYGADAFAAAYPDGRVAGVRIISVTEPEPLDTAGALAFAARAAGFDDQTMVVANGDVLTDGDLGALIAFHAQRGGDATIALKSVGDPSRHGMVVTDTAGRAVHFVEKPASGRVESNLANAGTYVLEPSVIAQIPPGRRVSVERDVFPALATAGRLFGRAEPDYCADLGTPGSYLAGNLALLDGTRAAPAPPAPGLVPVSGGWAAPSSEVLGSLGGACAVGAHARVDAGSRLERSVIGEGVRIGAGTYLRNAVVLAGAVIGTGARIEDSVVGPGAHVGCRCRVTGHSIVGAAAAIPDHVALDGARIAG